MRTVQMPLLQNNYDINQISLIKIYGEIEVQNQSFDLMFSDALISGKN